MSVVCSANLSDVDLALQDEAKSQCCFYCYKLVTTPAVLWAGEGGRIFLHAGCAVDLAIRILRDVHEIECKTHTYARLAL